MNGLKRPSDAIPALQEYLEIDPNSSPTSALGEGMTNLWALTASAGELDANSRAALASEMHEWIGAGGNGLVLQTCHRVELYGFGRKPELAGPRTKAGKSATSHLLRVAAGLESVIIGEDEVLHQVREALREAAASRPLDVRLSRLFETAIATGRTARSRRTQSSGNLAQSAVAWLGSRSRFSGGLVVVAGAGRMGAALAHSLDRAGASIAVASRDPDRASRLANAYGARGVGLSEGAQLASRAVAIAVALGGPWTELADFSAEPLPPVADISAPQAVPELVRGRLNGTFLGIDDLYRKGGELPGAYIKDAEAIVARKADEYTGWLGRRAG
ncbi:MAG TPA: NAD(P)-binding domain-containing protein [Candidatus Dormibacteraeota bacterium]|nr:NAD(P)-binding domain-containing protein [Candidatus Dormibacteraeota bacterium]